MEAKNKAKDLLDKFAFAIRTESNEHQYYTNMIHAKQCALIAVDEILNALDSDKIIYGSLYRYEESVFWNEVKTEIEKL